MHVDENEQTAELFIGLVSAVGTDLDRVCSLLQAEIESYGYKCSIITLSAKIVEFGGRLDLPDENSTEVERIEKLISAGNAIRRHTSNMAAVAALSVDEIRKIREKDTKNPKNILGPRCYILRSLKNPEEIKMFRKIYRDHFIVISVFERRRDRVTNLARRIASSIGDTDVEQHRADAEQIVTRDYQEDDEFGQNVSDAFAEADYFLRFMVGREMNEEIERFFKICFGFPFHTPQRDEMGMYWAQATAYRSADLSRQVGAAITNPRGELLATGCNEVPARGGGLPWEEDHFDPRDCARGHDENARMRNETVKEVLVSLKRAGWFEKDVKNLPDEEIVSKFEKDPNVGYSNMRLRNLIEFGRVVHAEMNAIVDAARRGISVQGGVLYCTTFPCHMCARQILAAGLKRVVFIEPYPKSLALGIYGDLISESELEEGTSFESFHGIAPRFFMMAFKMRKRKSADGSVLRWSRRVGSLDEIVSGISYAREEEVILSEVINAIERADEL